MHKTHTERNRDTEGEERRTEKRETHRQRQTSRKQRKTKGDERDGQRENSETEMEKRDIMADGEKLSAGERDTHTAVDTPLSQPHRRRYAGTSWLKCTPHTDLLLGTSTVAAGPPSALPTFPPAAVQAH